MADSHSYLKRLAAEHYLGNSYVHWSMTIEDRREGWLKPVFYYKFRELLTHTMFRYALCCPIFCCMPDHIHLLWIGMHSGSDQRKAVRHFRQRLNEVLGKVGFQLQLQPYDRVLRDDERQEQAFEAVVEYIARNPERKGLVATDRFFEYPYTDCLLPGYPEISIKHDDFWERFWRVESHLRRNGLLAIGEFTGGE